MLIAAFFFSVMSALVKIAGQTLPSQEIVLARNAVALAAGYVMVRRAGVALWGQNKRLLVWRGVVGFIALTCFYYSVTHLPLADATVLQFMNPIWTALLAAAILGERLDRRTVAAGLVSVFGVVILVRPSFIFGGQSLPTVPVVVAIVGSVTSAFAYVAVRELRRTEHPLTVVFYAPLIAFPLSIPTAAPTLVAPTLVELALMVGVGACAQLGQVYMTRGLHSETAARATTALYAQLVYAFVFGWVLFAEPPTFASASGAALVLAGVALVARRDSPVTESTLEVGEQSPLSR